MLNSSQLNQTEIAKVHCFEESTCYPLAFGFNLIILALALVCFLIGHPMYKMNPPSGTVLSKGVKCTIHAVVRKIRLRKVVIKEHWLDYADDKFDAQLIFDIKILLRVVLIYLLLPMILALFFLRFSSFILQATKLNNRVLGFEIEADQIQVLVPLLSISLIPILEYIVYPIFNKCNLLTSSLQKIIVGGSLMALSYLIAAYLQLSLEKHLLNCDAKYRLTIVNYTPCDVSVETPINSLATNDNQVKEKITEDDFVRGLNIIATNCTLQEEKINFHLYSNISETTVIFNIRGINPTINTKVLPVPQINIKYGMNVSLDNSPLLLKNKTSIRNSHMTDRYTDVMNINIKSGNICKVIAFEDQNGMLKWQHEDLLQCNSLSILLQIPQYTLLAAGEAMFYISAMEFGYSEAPTSMKSIIQSCFFLDSALANFMILIVQQMKFLGKESHKLFIYFGLAVLDIMVLILVAYKYKYRNYVILSKTPSTNEDIVN
ncbi:peptide transporter family 2-like [Centruroides sculpturatus]|uniref:peptide transporter family 2-like n=1 Tax=Centruroides sculpturatus TaxID=218467 RepID=UPI000C6E7DA0|nr:peptide transporter family 2-like [Centruroides sculpturatus]